MEQAREAAARGVRAIVRRLSSDRLHSAAALIVFLALWEGAVRLGYQDEFWVSRPTLVVDKIGEWLQDGTLSTNLVRTMRIAATAFLISAVGAVVVGSAFARLRWIDDVLGWYVDIVYAVPKPALVPLFLFAFGLGDTPKFLLVVLLVFFVFYYNVRAGLATSKQSHRDALLMLGASERDVWVNLTLPTLVPFLVASARLSAALAILGTVFAEFFSYTPGMGRLVISAQYALDATSLLSVVTVLTMVGVLVDNLLRRFDRRVSSWRL